MTKQMQRRQSSDPRTNHFLARLEPDDYDAFILKAKIVPLKFRKRLLKQDEVATAVYFPLTCMLSLLVTSDERPRIEMATIGREGVVGALAALQSQGAIGLNLVQVPGTAVRIEAATFRKIVAARPVVQALIQQHMYALMRQILYGAACNRIHGMKERCA